ncbi:unnamed protein product, partial [Mesorhabditis belari]|uniref:Alpha-carbonic anhydrase domain-containing protein n=1 Tax=Mesorhabditis belari TaxID=2138241 RepID=A0AAF3J3P1_9BILA
MSIVFCSCVGHSIEKRGTASCLACPSLLPSRCPLLDECNICTHSDFKDGNSMLGCLTSWISCPGGGATRVVLELWNGHTISRRSDRLGAFVCQSDGRWMVHELNYTVNDVKTATCYTAAADSQNSPINLNTKTAVRDPALGILQVNYAAGDGDSMTWGANSTFTLKTSVPYNRSTFAATQTDGSRYSLYQMHAHWGQKGAPGSEHSLDGQRYVAEFHFVHFNPDYATFDNSVGKENGIAVIGVFAQLGAANPEFDKILNAIKKGDASDVHGATAHLTSGLKFNYNKMMPGNN